MPLWRKIKKSLSKKNNNKGCLYLVIFIKLKIIQSSGYKIYNIELTQIFPWNSFQLHTSIAEIMKINIWLFNDDKINFDRIMAV